METTDRERSDQAETHELMCRLFILFMTLSFTGSAQESKEYADIISVEVSGVDNNYIFNVGISSPDTGCDQYANWWEVISTDGQLIYRRILGHSHVAEQPFVRSGGEMKIGEEQIVIIRAHMNTSGYGGIQFSGSTASGFEKILGNKEFAPHLSKEYPQPSGCAF